MQLRALIELSGYCETRNQFLHQRVHKTFSPISSNTDLVFLIITMRKIFLRIFCPDLSGQNIYRMKDNERIFRYGFNYLKRLLLFQFLLHLKHQHSLQALNDVTVFPYCLTIFLLLPQFSLLLLWLLLLLLRSMIIKNCANKQSTMMVSFFDLKISLFLEGRVYRLAYLYNRHEVI